MTITSKKCSFFGKTFDYMAHVIAPGKLHAGTKTTEAIKALQYPAAVSELRSFFGPCSISRGLVSNVTKLASPLKKKHRKELPLQVDLDKKKGKAVQVFKKVLITLPVLALPRSNS